MEKHEKSIGEEEVPNVTMKVTASAFPMRLFHEWDVDCKERFGDCRWMKMWNDHLASKSVEMYLDMSKQISELRSMVEKSENKEVTIKKPLVFSDAKEEKEGEEDE